MGRGAGGKGGWGIVGILSVEVARDLGVFLGGFVFAIWRLANGGGVYIKSWLLTALWNGLTC